MLVQFYFVSEVNLSVANVLHEQVVCRDAENYDHSDRTATKIHTVSDFVAHDDDFADVANGLDLTDAFEDIDGTEDADSGGSVDNVEKLKVTEVIHDTVNRYKWLASL